MADITIFVPGDPRGKARARSTFGRAKPYPEKKTVMAERDIAWQAKKSMRGAPPLVGPVMLKITARYDYPKSWSAKRKASTLWKTSKPDFDNIEKMVDALKGICWVDDAQVALNQTLKCYAREPQVAGLTIEIGTLTDEP